MIDKNSIEYTLPRNAYASFDAVSLKQLIIDKLSTSDVFRDQVFEGSNLNSLIDIVAFMYHVLLFQLNQNAAEGVFTQATIYENMNKLVSLINYKPTGLQTAFVEFNATASANLPVGSYLIKRFSSVNIDGYGYVLINDVGFEKPNAGEEEAVVLTDSILYQGEVTEYPPYTAIGEDFENITVVFENLVDPNNGRFISDNTFSVFVKESANDTWYIYTETPSLYLNLPGDRVFEKRFNENGRYEIKFGDGVNGKKLEQGDTVGIYFIVSDGQKGQISANELANKTLLPFNSAQFLEISNDIYTQDVTLLNDTQHSLVTLDNDYASTNVVDGESVEQIRANAPKIFSAQNRAVTLSDYKAITSKNFGYILASVEPTNNDYYVNNYIKYFYDIGLGKPNDDTGVLINQLNFMTSTNFNNIYLFMVPKFGTIRDETTPVALSVAQKQLVVNELNKVKSATHEVVPIDPVYKAFSFGLPLNNETVSIDIRNETFLVINRSELSKQSRQKIKNDVVTAIQNYFSVSNSQLGQIVNLTELSNNILSIEGVSSISTRRVSSNGTLELPSISLVYWNPYYPQADVNVSAQNIPLELFEFSFFYEQSQIVNKILIEDE